MECEAREWLRKFNQMKSESGLHAAQDWWRANIQSIEKRRGKESADQLRDMMNKLK